MDDAVAELAAGQYLLFTRDQAAGLGVSPKTMERRLQARRWLFVAPGVYSLPGAAPSWRRDLMAACLQAGPEAVVSHEAAAALHGLDTFPPGSVTVTVKHGDHQHLRAGRLRQSTDLGLHHRTVVDGLPVTTVARTFCDLAAGTRPARLRAALDSAFATRSCSVDDVRRCLEELRRPGKRGLRRLAALLEARTGGRVPAPSTLERRLKLVLRENGLPIPVREHELPWDRQTQGRVDFAYPGQRIIIEADSRRWHTRERDFEVDRRRDREAQLAGWDVYRFTWEDLRTCPEEVAATVRRALALSRK